MTTTERIKAVLAFGLAWLSTPSSKAGLTVILTAILGSKFKPEWIDAISTAAMVIAGAALVAWPEKPKT